MEKVVLAYSGGLDTTAIIPWLKETYGYEVVCCCIDCGQEEELDGLDERAQLSGASKLYIEDIIDDFADNYIMPCVQAGAVYEHKYLMGTAMARPGIAKKLVEIARKENAEAICTEQQVRVMIRFVSSSESRHLHQTSRLSHHGVMTDGRWIHVRQRLTTARLMESTFHLEQTSHTVVTETFGTSAMRVSSLRILHRLLTMTICLYLVLHQRRLQMSQ